MAIEHRTGHARSGDLSIHYRRLGRVGGTPLLVVHGLSYFSYDWLPVAAELGTRREVVCIDMRGFGDSGRSATGDYSVPSMAQDIIAVLDHLGWDRAVLVGHSMGGRSTSYAAGQHPARIGGLVLVDYTPDNAPGGSQRVTKTVAGAPDRFASVEAAMQYFSVDPHSPAGASKRERFEAYLRKVEGGYEIKRDPYFANQFRRLLETGERVKQGVDMWQVIGEVKCPILALRGQRSDMFAIETIPKLLATNARITLVEIDAGHNIGGDNPQGLLAVVQPFLASLEQTR